MILDSLGSIDEKKLLDVLQKARSGQEVRVALLTRPVGLELWLRGLRNWNVLDDLGRQGELPQPTYASSEV